MRAGRAHRAHAAFGGVHNFGGHDHARRHTHAGRGKDSVHGARRGDAVFVFHKRLRARGYTQDFHSCGGGSRRLRERLPGYRAGRRAHSRKRRGQRLVHSGDGQRGDGRRRHRRHQRKNGLLSQTCLLQPRHTGGELRGKAAVHRARLFLPQRLRSSHGARRHMPRQRGGTARAKALRRGHVVVGHPARDERGAEKFGQRVHDKFKIARAGRGFALEELLHARHKIFGRRGRRLHRRDARGNERKFGRGAVRAIPPNSPASPPRRSTAAGTRAN